MPETFYPSPNIEVEAQNQIDSERAKAEQTAADEATQLAIATAKAAIKDEAELAKKIQAARDKAEADFLKEEASIRAKATKSKVVVEAKETPIAKTVPAEKEKATEKIK